MKAAEPTISAKDLQNYAKAAQTIYKMLGQEAPQGPQRRENETDQQYSAESQQYFQQYLGLDAKSVDAAGEVGSPEAMAYILARADEIISQLGVDPDQLLRGRAAARGEDAPGPGAQSAHGQHGVHAGLCRGRPEQPVVAVRAYRHVLLAAAGSGRELPAVPIRPRGAAR